MAKTSVRSWAKMVYQGEPRNGLPLLNRVFLCGAARPGNPQTGFLYKMTKKARCGDKLYMCHTFCAKMIATYQAAIGETPLPADLTGSIGMLEFESAGKTTEQTVEAQP